MLTTGKWELVLVWANGDKDIHEYNTKESAEKGGENVKLATGDQLQWWGVREQIA